MYYICLMFKIADILPLRFIHLNNISAAFNGDFAVRQLLDYQSPRCYAQKWELGDVLKLQCPSLTPPTALEIREVDTDFLAYQVNWVEIPTLITGQTFKIYELEQSLSVLNEGRYYTSFQYENEDGIQPVQSEAIDVQIEQDNTLLIEYHNARNDYDIIFDTGIVFQIRVEAAIKNFLPQNERDTYEDQDFNTTLLNAIPYLQAKFWLGYNYGMPRWVAHKINIIQSCTETIYDGVAYQIPNEAKYEWVENDLGDDWIGGSVDIRPVDNRFNRYETEVIEPENIFTPMQKRLRYFNVGANLAIPSVFDDHSMLESIWIKKSTGTFEMSIGTTPNGDEIGEVTVDANNFIWSTEYIFDGNSTLYLSGLDGANISELQVIYKQLDVDDIDLSDLGGGEVPSVQGVPLYGVIQYGGDSVQLSNDFDLTTGVGRPNTEYANYVLMDGRNGTIDMGGLAPVGYKELDPVYSLLGTPFGSKTATLTLSNLPEIGDLIDDRVTGRRPGFGSGENIIWPKSTKKVGSSTPTGVSISQPSIPVIFVKRVA